MRRTPFSHFSHHAQVAAEMYGFIKGREENRIDGNFLRRDVSPTNLLPWRSFGGNFLRDIMDKCEVPKVAQSEHGVTLPVLNRNSLVNRHDHLSYPGPTHNVTDPLPVMSCQVIIGNGVTSAAVCQGCAQSENGVTLPVLNRNSLINQHNHLSHPGPTHNVTHPLPVMSCQVIIGAGGSANASSRMMRTFRFARRAQHPHTISAPGECECEFW
jgi:hypothetical protein